MCSFSRFGFGILALTTAFGHDLYLMPDRFIVAKGERLGFALHNGDAFPESEASVTVERLRDGALHAGHASTPVENLRIDGKRTVGEVNVVESGDLVLAVRTIPNFIEMEPAKFHDYLKEEGLTEVIDWRVKNGEASKPGRERYSKYAKSLLLAGTPNSNSNKVVGFPIEIVPEKDPYKLHKGDSLPVRVLVNGKPAAGLQLEAAWTVATGSKVQAIGRTDKDGRISVPLTTAGKWRLHSIKMVHLPPGEPPVKPGEASPEWESIWASLTFEIR